MLISIIIPAYNVENYIFNCLSSLSNQIKKSKLDFEILVINDGSTDQTENEITKFNDFPVRYFNQENKGASAARNLGLSHANGDYIWFVDSDDSIRENAINTIEKNILSFPKKTLIFNYYTVDKNGNEKRNEVPLKLGETKAFQGADFVSDGRFPSYLWIVLYNANLIKQFNIKFLEGTKNLEDFHFNMQYFLNVSPLEILFINEYTYNYNYNPISTSRNMSQSNLEKLADDSFRIHMSLKNMASNIGDKKSKLALNKELDNSILGFFYSLHRFYDFDTTKKYIRLYKENDLVQFNSKAKNLKSKLFRFFIKSNLILLIKFFK
ncbi:glycosyltransferase family 2 protein [Ornithobacterium rhinotracheale]